MTYKQKEEIGNATLYLADSKELLPQLNSFKCILYDPPFEIWKDLDVLKADNIIAFCSPTSRHAVEKILGKPRSEIVWHFADGRWVSKNLPRITHDYVYIYGDTSSANVGEYQSTKGSSKGNSSIGKDVLGKRFYTPKERKHLNSVQIFPENVLDPFMGSGTTIEACYQLGIKSTGIEINQKYFDVACNKLEQASKQQTLFNYQSFKQPTFFQ